MLETMIRALSIIALVMLATAATAKEVAIDLSIGDGSRWSFQGGKWTQNEADKPFTGEGMHTRAGSEKGVITPPDVRNSHCRAFYKGQAFEDMVVEFDYNANYRENGTGDAGLIFRAVDSNHFYFLHFPWGAQQLRAKHYWAALAKVEGGSYIRNIQMNYVPGIPSEIDRWFHVRLEAKGPRMQVWVDGRRALDVTDKTFNSGFAGLAGYGMYYFRNIHIIGSTARAPKWNGDAPIPRHTFTVPGLSSNEMPSACIAPNGDILLAVGTKISRSKDKGRTWSEAVDVGIPDVVLSDYGASLFRTSKGKLMIMHLSVPTPGAKANVNIYESKDNGLTWSAPTAAEVADGWPAAPAKPGTYGPMVETADGTLLRFLLAGEQRPPGFDSIHTWGSYHAKAYVVRSTDEGKSWSAPIEIDQPYAYNTPRGSVPGSLDLTEPTGVAIGNKVTVVIRPIFSPQMWQCWSNDAGATWDSGVRTTFPGYAQSMVRTKSGVILVAHRYPGYSVNVSRDNGLNWDDGTLIDWPAWAMGTLTEVEPDTILCTYMNAGRDMPLVLQLIKVEKDRIEPVIVNR